MELTIVNGINEPDVNRLIAVLRYNFMCCTQVGKAVLKSYLRK